MVTWIIPHSRGARPFHINCKPQVKYHNVTESPVDCVRAWVVCACVGVYVRGYVRAWVCTCVGVCVRGCVRLLYIPDVVYNIPMNDNCTPTPNTTNKTLLSHECQSEIFQRLKTRGGGGGPLSILLYTMELPV